VAAAIERGGRRRRSSFTRQNVPSRSATSAGAPIVVAVMCSRLDRRAAETRRDHRHGGPGGTRRARARRSRPKVSACASLSMPSTGTFDRQDAVYVQACCAGVPRVGCRVGSTDGGASTWAGATIRGRVVASTASASPRRPARYSSISASFRCRRRRPHAALSRCGPRGRRRCRVIMMRCSATPTLHPRQRFEPMTFPSSIRRKHDDQVGINGFGRIGRMVLRAACVTFRTLSGRQQRPARTRLTSPTCWQYDSVHGRFKGTLAVEGSTLVVNGRQDPG